VSERVGRFRPLDDEFPVDIQLKVVIARHMNDSADRLGRQIHLLAEIGVYIFELGGLLLAVMALENPKWSVFLEYRVPKPFGVPEGFFRLTPRAL
jgi:hypothetical protein